MTTVSPPPRLAVVTSADSGIGKATAELLATEGFDVGITFHTDEAGAEDTRGRSRSVASAAPSPART